MTTIYVCFSVYRYQVTGKYGGNYKYCDGQLFYNDLLTRCCCLKVDKDFINRQLLRTESLKLFDSMSYYKEKVVFHVKMNISTHR